MHKSYIKLCDLIQAGEDQMKALGTVIMDGEMSLEEIRFLVADCMEEGASAEDQVLFIETNG